MSTAGEPRSVAARLPYAPGVYRFRDVRGRALYVGRARDLRRRVSSYWVNLGDRPHLASMVARIARVEAVSCDSAHEAAWLERNLLERAKPSWNRATGGAEVPVYLCLDARPASPGLRVVHTVPDPRPWETQRPPQAASTASTATVPPPPAARRQALLPATLPCRPIGAGGGGVRYFGPYLGGFKVRSAISALHRLAPLPYTGERLTSAERDLARILGVAARDRAGFVHAVTGVLDRDPEALGAAREELVRLRDAAAAGLAFERAARIQAEIEALDWVAAPQRATQSEPHDLDVYGWADGVLVRFDVRAGRLCGWTQRPCAEATARRRVADTPADWTEFARRNAELAARLSRSDASVRSPARRAPRAART